MASKYDNYKLKDCDLLLNCSDGASGRIYQMPCLRLQRINDANMRVLVFGDRNEQQQESLKTMRIIPITRIQEKEQQ